MIVWHDRQHPAHENMRRDAALLGRLEAGAGGGEAVLRVYGFAPPGITLGRSQSPARELDLGACRRDGVEWATRPTGGRAIYHDEEWTYALAARIDDRDWGGSLHEAYARASRLLVEALGRIGIPARLAPGAPRGAPDRPADAGAAAPCFASTARHEIVLGGRKLVGSAQRRGALALLQQGSILLGPAHRRLSLYLASAPAREAARRQLEDGAAQAGAPWRADDAGPLVEALLAALGAAGHVVDAAAGLDLLTGSNADPYAGGELRTGTARDHPDKEMRS